VASYGCNNSATILQPATSKKRNDGANGILDTGHGSHFEHYNSLVGQSQRQHQEIVTIG